MNAALKMSLKYFLEFILMEREVYKIDTVISNVSIHIYNIMDYAWANTY